MEAIFIDAVTQNFSLKNGMILNGNSDLTEAYMRLVTPLKSWIYGSSTFGSRLYQLESQRQQVNATELTQVIQEALQPMINAQRVLSMQIQFKVIGAGYFKFVVGLLDADNQIIKFTYSSVV